MPDMIDLKKYEVMKKVRNDPSRVVILGAGDDGVAMMETLQDETLMRIIAVVDSDKDSPGIYLAQQMGIKTYTDVEEALIASAPCIVFNLTGNEMVEELAASTLGVGAVIGGSAAKFMWQMVTELKRTKNSLEFQATHDFLTDLINRRHMSSLLLSEMERCRRYKMSCSVIVLDLDHFKKINDTYGHAVGDEVLKTVASNIVKDLRGSDVVARWGGEEFLALLPHTEKKIAGKVVNKWLSNVMLTPVRTEGHHITVSFSAGIAEFNEIGDVTSAQDALDKILDMADLRLYNAKEHGRSRVEID